MSGETQPAVLNKSRRAVLLSRRYPRGDSLTYLGGTPLMPPNMQWPTYPNNHGYFDNFRSMPFLAQIDLSELQHLAPPEMPSHGILYFLLDESSMDDGEGQDCVFYTSETNDLAPAIPSSHLTRMDEETVYTCTYNNSDIIYKPFSRDRYPKYEVDLVPFKDVDLQNWTEELSAEAEIERDNALSELYGIAGLQVRKAMRDWDRYDCLQLLTGDPSHPVSPIFNNWPQSWIFIGLHLIDYINPDSYVYKSFPDCLLKHEFIGECHQWVEKVLKYGDFTPLTPEQKDEYRNWVANKFQSSFKKQGVEPGQYYIWNHLRDALQKSIDIAMTLCIDAEQSNRNIIDTNDLECYTNRLWSQCGHHQVFGYGTNIHNAANNNRDNVLLLQLGADLPMIWWGQGCLQFWISRDDLSRREFDKAFATMEG